MREGQSYLNDPAKTLAWVVTLPELLPITEALELIQGLRDTQVETGGVILNRLPVDPFEADEREALNAILASQPMHGEIAFRRIGTAREAAALLAKGTDLPIVELPEATDAKAENVHEALTPRLGEWLTRR
jgi:hypothetical protein